MTSEARSDVAQHKFLGFIVVITQTKPIVPTKNEWSEHLRAAKTLQVTRRVFLCHSFERNEIPREA